ncbi:hypothetical protein FJZ36_09625 [Candidatus Poribacteria bacterium]|nr:hypothetical protein [Candidatus Poribacteria bacterium]
MEPSCSQKKKGIASVGRVTAIARCDVLDRAKLQEFHRKRREWLEWIDGRNRRAIWCQVQDVSWNLTLYSTVVDLLAHSDRERPADAYPNPWILRMFCDQFYVSQALAIRRLLDPQPKNTLKGVISLRRLLDDIKQHRCLFTREVYVAHDGLPYDYVPVHDRWPFCGAEPAGVYTAPWRDSELAHQDFDRLARSSRHFGDLVTQAGRARRRTEPIDCDWFNWLDKLLKSKPITDLEQFVNKHIAHTADNFSRQSLTRAQSRLGLNQLWKCLEPLFQVLSFVHGSLLQGPAQVDVVPHVLDDHLTGLDKPWVHTSAVPQACQSWQKHAKALNDLWGRSNALPRRR